VMKVGGQDQGAEPGCCFRAVRGGGGRGEHLPVVALWVRAARRRGGRQPARRRPRLFQPAVLRNLSPMLMVDTDVPGMIRLDLEPIA
jgi:hypothetical protein